MARTRKSLTLPDSLPAAARKLFKRFPTTVSADDQEYEERLTTMFAAVQPRDSIEAFWAKDLVDMTLEIEQLRQIEAGLLEAHARDADGRHDAIDRHVAEVAANFAVAKWAGDRGLDHRSETPEIKAQWAKFHQEQLSASSPQATPVSTPGDPNDLVQSFLRHGAELDQVGRMIATVEARRRSVLREMEHYRTVRRARSGTTAIIEASFTEPGARP
jgi:hypothetical protein